MGKSCREHAPPSSRCRQTRRRLKILDDPVLDDDIILTQSPYAMRMHAYIKTWRENERNMEKFRSEKLHFSILYRDRREAIVIDIDIL